MHKAQISSIRWIQTFNVVLFLVIGLNTALIFQEKKTETIQKIQYCGCADSRTRTQTPCKYYAYQIKSNKNYGHQLQGCISQNHPFAFVKKQIWISSEADHKSVDKQRVFFLSKVFALHTQIPHIHSESIAFTNLVIQHAARHASCVMLKNVVRCLSMLYPTSTSVPLVSSANLHLSCMIRIPN